MNNPSVCGRRRIRDTKTTGTLFNQGGKLNWELDLAWTQITFLICGFTLHLQTFSNLFWTLLDAQIKYSFKPCHKRCWWWWWWWCQWRCWCWWWWCWRWTIMILMRTVEAVGSASCSWSKDVCPGQNDFLLSSSDIKYHHFMMTKTLSRWWWYLEQASRNSHWWWKSHYQHLKYHLP